MKVVAVLGSPRSTGASSSIAREILRGAESVGHETVIYDLNQMNVKGCQACRYCKEHWTDCILKDDLKPYWEDLHTCGALILASPNYCSQVTGPMITFMNRHYCLMMMQDGKGVPRISNPIKLIGVFSQGNRNEQAYLPQYKWFLGDFEARTMQLTDILVHTGGMSYEPGSEIMQRAYLLGSQL